ncbi:MAG: hypothetical protein QGI83_22850 [Candidatus Latescibacteria bacterium]|nr:hypothetical protein [Candidatus Latescibacterota bacterium]
MKTLLFFDDWWLLRRLNMERRLGTPEWVPEAVLEDNICEGTWNNPFVFRDEETDKWIGLYGGHYYPEPGVRHSTGLNIAESDDGIHWVKPDVSERVPIPDRNRPNQVLSVGTCDGGPAFLDERDPDPERRLKLLYSGYSDRRMGGGDMMARELMLATSADGYAWRVEALENWGVRPLDAPISAFYNDELGTYMVNSRPLLGDRRVALTPTSDFKRFEDPILVMHPDPEDPPLVQFYGMPVYPYDGMYIGLLWRIHIDPFVLTISQGEVDCCLTYSRNGLVFNRAYHEPFVPRNPRGMYGGGCLYPSCVVVDDDHQIRLYSGASKTGHFQTNAVTDAALALHTLRLDGFVYLESYATTGSVATRPVQFHGPNLTLNVCAPYGTVRAQLIDSEGKPYPGFGFEDSVPFTGDELFHSPKWKGDPGIATLGGSPVHIEIEVTRGEIYAIRGDFTISTANPNVLRAVGHQW